MGSVRDSVETTFAVVAFAERDAECEVGFLLKGSEERAREGRAKRCEVKPRQTPPRVRAE